MKSIAYSLMVILIYVVCYVFSIFLIIKLATLKDNEDVSFLKGLEEKEQELINRKGSGEIVCNFDTDGECLSCGS